MLATIRSAMGACKVYSLPNVFEKYPVHWQFVVDNGLALCASLNYVMLRVG